MRALGIFRYSDRVKAETERMEKLQLDDFEVVCIVTWFLLALLKLKFYPKYNIPSYGLQMDEDEKYNRKLESGLYTLQVGIFRTVNRVS